MIKKNTHNSGKKEVKRKKSGRTTIQRLFLISLTTWAYACKCAGCFENIIRNERNGYSACVSAREKKK